MCEQMQVTAARYTQCKSVKDTIQFSSKSLSACIEKN